MLAGENFSDPPLNDSPGLSGARFSMVIWRLSSGKLLLPPKSNLFNLAVILFKSCFVFKVSHLLKKHVFTRFCFL